MGSIFMAVTSTFNLKNWLANILAMIIDLSVTLAKYR